MRLRPGTLVDLMDIRAIPSEGSIGEVCAIIGECGYNIKEVEDTWSATTVVFQRGMNTGSLKIDRERGVFDVAIVDNKGYASGILTNDDAEVFQYLVNTIVEEVDIRDKYKHLTHPARHLFAWLLQQYSASGVYVFSPNDIGADMAETDKSEALDQLIQQGFLRMTSKDAVVLDRTLADDMRSKSDLLDSEEPEEESDDLGLDII